MKLINKGVFYLTILLVILSMFTEETEARRQVLRGRKTITRRYYRGLAIPAWAIIIICGLANLIIGAVLYIVMRKVILSTDPDAQTNTYTPAPMHDVHHMSA